jgi:hypothetical protein
LPKLSQFKNLAIFGDLTHLPQRVETRHRVGINVLYGNGSARWVERKVFDDDLKLCTSLSNAQPINDAQDRIWQALDRQ